MAPPEEQRNVAKEGDQDVSASTSQRMHQLKALRTSTKGNISRMQKLINKKALSLSTEELNCRLSMLEEYFRKFNCVQDDIDEIRSAVELVANEAATAEVEDLYVSSKSKMMSLLAKRKSSVSEVSAMNSTASFVAAPRARRDIKLPKFDGKYSVSKFHGPLQQINPS